MLVLNRRRQGQAPDVVAIAIKAQHRLYKKFWRLDQRKHRHVAITAVARELCCFVWAVLNAAPISLMIVGIALLSTQQNGG
ncbi:MAG: hypothetical protein OER90_13680 [Gemmatimonadota bacterium]|nr:hypothetical protein [Gemmatimonadota bacterium]